MTYAAFIAAKQREVAPIGIEVAADDIHPMLFGFQRQIVQWAALKGRAALFADTGLGKTFMQVEWARLVAERPLIVAPLAVARQTVREAAKLGVDVTYARRQSDAAAFTITNYELLDHFDADQFDAVVLDESSILKNVDGKTRQAITSMFAKTPRRLACTATPAPNDVAELCNHAEFLGIMPRNEMLAAYFIHDSDVGWRLKGHAADPMFRWMSGWALAIRKPSDLGYPNEGYDLPPMTIAPHIVDVGDSVKPDDQLFATDLGGVGGRAKVRRATMEHRVARAVELANRPGQWIVWCGLNGEATDAATAIDGAVNVEGSWSPDDKAAAFESFQDGGIRVLVSKPSICGFGMNFQNCHQMVFLGLSDSYEAYYQSIRRCFRFGQSRPVDVHIVVSDIEQQIVSNVRAKERTAADSMARLVRFMSEAQSPTKENVA